MVSKHARRSGAALVCAVLVAWITPSSGQDGRSSAESFVRVEYVRAETFTDVEGTHAGDNRFRTAYLEQLERHLAWRAVGLLREGQRLVVIVTDVDRAGRFEPWRRDASGIRIVRDIYPPRIDLRFRLEHADGRVLKQGERKLQDPIFVFNPTLYRGDALRYEKILLDRWLERELWQQSKLDDVVIGERS